MTIEYLDLEDLLAAGAAARGHAPEVGDYGLLESALARPRANVFGQDAYPDLHHKAAALLESLLKNHALIDGNTRLGWVATRLFYGYNGYVTSASSDEKFELVMAVAISELNTVTEIAHRLSGMFSPAG